MNILIGEPVKKRTLVYVYKIKINFSFGDGDFDKEQTFYISPDNKYLYKFVQFLEACKKAYPRGKGGYDTYDYVSYAEWFIEEALWKKLDEELITQEEYQKIYDESIEDTDELHSLIFSWPMHEGWLYNMNGYIITYFDATGVEHYVTIE